MVELRALGAIDLRRDGTEISSVLTRPKHLALLLYLDLAQPRGYHRRSQLTSLIWPELGESEADEALTRTVDDARRELGENTLATRGDRLMLDPVYIRSDVRVLDAALDNTDDLRAVQLYQGPLADGFSLGDGDGFDTWLNGERDRLRTSVANAAWSLANKARANGRIDEATMYARSATSLTRDDEESVRRLMTFLESVGDRAGALRSYDEFVVYLSGEFDATPDPDTAALRNNIRDGNVTHVEPAANEPAAPTPPAVPTSPIAPPAPTVPAPPVTTEIRNADVPGSPRYASYAFAAVAVAILALIATRFFN